MTAHDPRHDLEPLARIAPAVVTGLLLFGVWLGEAWWFWALAPMALAGALFGVHPLDLVYNEVLAPIAGLRRIARCGSPRRFALTIAALWLIATGFAFQDGPSLIGGVLAGFMGAATFATATLDFCMPCWTFSLLFTQRRPMVVAADDEPTVLLP